MNRLAKITVVIASLGLVGFLLLGTVLGRTANPEDVYRHFAVYTEVLSRIKSEYVEEPDMQNVTLGALNGMLESIDPYASYLNEEQYQQYQEGQNTKQAGLGLILSRKVGYVSVVSAIPGSPAAKAGLATTDMIETIDGVATRDMPLAYAEMLLQGEAGTDVEFTVLRVRQSTEPQEFTLVRENVESPPVVSELINEDIGHIRVRSLETGKAAEVADHVKLMKKRGAKQIILDLRQCASGDPKEGLALADLFLNEGLMAYVIGQKVPRQDFRATSAATVSELPMVTLLDRGSARGAEIAAAALLENKRCEVVGERSYGDAALRKAVRLNGSGAVILSVAKYHSPDGKAIQDTGVTPSVVSIAVEDAPEGDLEGQRIEPVPEPALDEDTILQKSIEVLRKGPPKEVALETSAADTGFEDGLTPLGIPQHLR
jgi:carboxyl-terminal processing protease